MAQFLNPPVTAMHKDGAAQPAVLRILPQTAPAHHLNEESPPKEIVAFKYAHAQGFLSGLKPGDLSRSQTQQIEKAMQDYNRVYFGHSLNIKGMTLPDALDALTGRTMEELKTASPQFAVGIGSDYTQLEEAIAGINKPSSNLMDRFFASQKTALVGKTTLNLHETVPAFQLRYQAAKLS